LGDLTLRRGLPERPELLKRYVVCEVVPRVDHDRESIQGYRDLDELDAVLLTGLDLIIFYRPGSVRDLGLSAAERLEAVAGTGPADSDPDVRILPIERLGCRLGDREHGAGALDGYLAGSTAAFLRFRIFFFLSPAASATSQNQGKGQEKRPDQQT
jgi:hypothetical protein